MGAFRWASVQQRLRQPAHSLIALPLLAGAISLGGACAAEAPAANGENIIVSGASGQLGGMVVKELLSRGVAPENLILVSRTPEELQEYAALGARTRFGDFTQPESLAAAYEGGTRMLLISINTVGPERPELHKNAIDAAVAAGIRHIVYTSFVDLDNNPSALAADHRRTEEFLKESGLAWTMLRNQLYMDGLITQAARMAAAGRVVVQANDSGIAYVAREDCAAAAAAVLTGSGHENRAYDITGSQLIGQREIALATAEVTGVPIEVVESGEGVAPGAAAAMGGASLEVQSTAVADLTGRPPITGRDLLEANRETLLAL